MLEDYLSDLLKQALSELGLDLETVELTRPALNLGDYSTNVALVVAKKLDRPPLALAKEIKDKLLLLKDERIKDVQVAGPGFINFYLSVDFFHQALQDILIAGETFGRTKILARKKVMVEYTDPNPFKEFHIGHLMSNAIGETISRIIEANGAEVKRACYQGDVGLHVAKTLWGVFKKEADLPSAEASLSEKIKFLGQAYTFGTTEYESGTAEAKEGINIINKKIYKRNDPKLNEIYDLGRQWSLAYFESIYAKLGTKFDYYFFESETWSVGQKLVMLGLAQGIFKKSAGAVIFPADDYEPSLHTRVFINSAGVTTYEAKDLGLAKLKDDTYASDLSIVITGSEQTDYFRVLQKALEQILPALARQTRHLSHGFLRLPSGKMSSRAGQIITAESLMAEVQEKVLAKINEDDLTPATKNTIAEAVAIGAIKYSILKQTPGKDVVFDFEKSLSFEGDSGPYLQYAYARARSLLKKASLEPESISSTVLSSDLIDDSLSDATELLRLLVRLPEVLTRAYFELAPQYLTTYLITVAGAFNRFYAQAKIIGGSDEKYHLQLVEATSLVLRNGLQVLAIPVLEKM